MLPLLINSRFKHICCLSKYYKYTENHDKPQIDQRNIAEKCIRPEIGQKFINISSILYYTALSIKLTCRSYSDKPKLITTLLS